MLPPCCLLHPKPRSLQLEEVHRQQWRPSTAKDKWVNENKGNHIYAYYSKIGKRREKLGRRHVKVTWDSCIAKGRGQFSSLILFWSLSYTWHSSSLTFPEYPPFPWLSWHHHLLVYLLPHWLSRLVFFVHFSFLLILNIEINHSSFLDLLYTNSLSDLIQSQAINITSTSMIPRPVSPT